MTFGEQIIHELGRRGRRGMYFSFEGYDRLRRVKNDGDLRDFLIGERFPDPPHLAQVADAVNYLNNAPKVLTFEDIFVLFALAVLCKLEPGLSELPLFAFGMYLSIRRKPRRLLPTLNWPLPWSEPLPRV